MISSRLSIVCDIYEPGNQHEPTTRTNAKEKRLPPKKQTKLTTSGLMTAYKTLKFQHVHEVAGNNPESPPILQCFRTFSTPMLLNWGKVPRELAPNMQNEFRCLPKGKLPVAEEIWKTTALRIIRTKANFAASHQDDIFLLHIFLPHLQNLEDLLHSNQQYHWSPFKKHHFFFVHKICSETANLQGLTLAVNPIPPGMGSPWGFSPRQQFMSPVRTTHG